MNRRRHRSLWVALEDLDDEVGDRLTQEVMTAEARKRGYEGLDLRLTVRLPFATVPATAVFDGPVMTGIGRRPSRDTIVEEWPR
jgi:hypothetical protein